MVENGALKSSLMLINSRKEVIIAITWSTALATVIAGKGTPPILESFLSILAILLISLSVYIYNDVVDREMDAYSSKEKKKKRPIAHGVVSITNAMRFVYITAILGLFTSLIVNKIVFSIGLFYYSLFFLYSYPRVRFKTKFIVKNMVTAAGMPISFLVGGAAVNGSLSPIIMFLSALYYVFLFLALPAGQDCSDLEEDIAFNIKTIGGVLTWRQNLLLFNLAVLVMVAGSVISNKLFSMSYLTPILMAGIGIPVILFNMRISNLDITNGLPKFWPVAYAYLMLTPLILALGAFF